MIGWFRFRESFLNISVSDVLRIIVEVLGIFISLTYFWFSPVLISEVLNEVFNNFLHHNILFYHSLVIHNNHRYYNCPSSYMFHTDCFKNFWNISDQNDLQKVPCPMSKIS